MLKSNFPVIDLLLFTIEYKVMKSHLFIALGLTLGLIFVFQGFDAINTPGLGLREIYVLGGFVFAGLLIRQGWIDRKDA